MSLSKKQIASLEATTKIERVPVPDLPTFDTIDPKSFALGIAFASKIVSFFTVNASQLAAEKALSGYYTDEQIAVVPDQITALGYQGFAVTSALSKHIAAVMAISVLREIQAKAKASASHAAH